MICFFFFCFKVWLSKVRASTRTSLSDGERENNAQPGGHAKEGGTEAAEGQREATAEGETSVDTVERHWWRLRSLRGRCFVALTLFVSQVQERLSIVQNRKAEEDLLGLKHTDRLKHLTQDLPQVNMFKHWVCVCIIIIIVWVLVDQKYHCV